MAETVNQTTIANLALLETGEEPLTLLSDKKKAASIVKIILPQVRNECFDLPDNWKFCTARASLTQFSSAPDFGYDYQYALPDDCRRIIETVDENGDAIQYRYTREIYVKGSTKQPVLLCNEEECRIKYIVLLTNPVLWPAWFARLVYLGCAIRLAKPLTTEERMKLNLEYAWKQAYRIAQAANAMEDSSVDRNHRNTDHGNNDVLNAANMTSSNQESELYCPGWL